ncbi:hypothetical protein [Marinitoga sp. 1155]|uniref:hypothetical protein n=1 Tax=Marinitoga sp. 1155 TaxID=1428448 RepID=UPI0006414119|nr:hypothetical protein [Marinitoga sp. 1155]KLO24146.1 hypothetical protein X274_04450 [Marinitoga sp. 1155]
MKNKYFLFIILILSIFLLTSCFNFKKDVKNQESFKSIIIEKNNNEYIIKSNVEADSFEFVFENTNINNIYIPSKFLKIIKNDAGLKVAISSPGIIHRGDILLKVTDKDFKLKSINTYNRNSITKNFDYYNKGVSFGLLGDFDFDGKVDISDFSSFTYFYGLERDSFNGNMKDFDLIDIGPAGNFAHKGIWDEVFDLAKPDGKIGLSDFSIFAANYGIDVISTQPTITVTSDTNPDIITDDMEKDIVSGLKNIYNTYSHIMTFLNENKDFISSLTSFEASPQIFIKYIINMSDATETALLNIIKDINNISLLFGTIKNGYLYTDVKYKINEFDWDMDGTVESTSPLKLKIKTENGEDSIPFYDLLKIDQFSRVLGIDPAGGDAIFDYELINENISENHNPTFDDNDYILIDEGTAGQISLVTGLIGIIGKSLFIYDLNNPSENIKAALKSNVNLMDKIDEILKTLLKNPPPLDSEKITGWELETYIFGHMLYFKDYNTSIELINTIKNELISLHDILNKIFEDRIMDYIIQPHDPTSGDTPPVKLEDFIPAMDGLKKTEELAQIIQDPSKGIDIPLEYNKNITIYPGVFFNNPDDFSNLNVFLPDIYIEESNNSTNLIVEFPDSTFKGLISGLDSKIEINLEDFGKEKGTIHLEDITIIGTSVTFQWTPKNINNATITYELIIDNTEWRVWDYIDGNLSPNELIRLVRTPDTQVTIDLNEGSYFWAVIGYADFGNGNIEIIYPENPYWFNIYVEDTFYYIDLISPENEWHSTDAPAEVNFEWKAFIHKNNMDEPIIVDKYVLYIEQLTEPYNYFEYQLSSETTSISLDTGKYRWNVMGYYQDPETFEEHEIYSDYFEFKIGDIEETAYFYKMEPPDYVPSLPGDTTTDVYFRWGVNNLNSQIATANIFELYYREITDDNWIKASEDINILWYDEDYGSYEAEMIIPELSVGKEYEWKIRAFIDESNYIESEIWYFFIEEGTWMLDLHLIQPLDGDATQANNIGFIWGMDPSYTGDFELHIRPIDTWENMDILITPDDYSTGTDMFTGEMTFNYNVNLEDGAYKYWLSLANVEPEEYQETEHRWFFINTEPYEVLLDYPEQNAVFDYYTIWFSWHHIMPPPDPDNPAPPQNMNYIFEVINEEGNIIYNTNLENQYYVTVDFDNPGIYYWHIMDDSGNIISATFTFEIKDIWGEPEENKLQLFTPLNGEFIISSESFKNIGFTWENLGENIEYTFFLKSAKELIETDTNYIESFDYVINPDYNLELKDGPYIWMVNGYDDNYSFYNSNIRSFNISSSDNSMDIEVYDSFDKTANPLDTISFYASNTANQIEYHILLFTPWQEVWTYPGIFETSLIGNPNEEITIELWQLFNKLQYGDIYYYAILADDGNETIISPVKSFIYDPLLKGNYVSFAPQYLENNQNTFQLNTSGDDLTEVYGIEFYLKTDPEITFDASNISISDSDIDFSLIKSSIKFDDYTDEEYKEIIISIIFKSPLDLSDTEIASFTLNNDSIVYGTTIEITDAFILFEENKAPVLLEIENSLEVHGQ